jgi:hypothetical protein
LLRILAAVHERDRNPAAALRVYQVIVEFFPESDAALIARERMRDLAERLSSP